MLCFQRTVLSAGKPAGKRIISCHRRRLLSLPQQQHRSWTSLSADDIMEIRETLRPYGGDDDCVTLQLASQLENHDSPLLALGNSTAIVTLCNSASRNALTGKMMAELADVVDQLEQECTENSSTSCVIVRGKDGFFCAGADLGVARNNLLSTEGGRSMSTLMIDTTTRLRQLPLVSISAIQGMAIGGGAELATATDYRIMDADASMRFVHAKMGVTPGWGGATRLTRLVGRQYALELLGTAQPCDANQCFNMGLVDKIVQGGESSVMENALVQFLDRFVHSNPKVLHSAKRVVANAEDAACFEDAVASEQRVFLTMWGGEANREALSKSRDEGKSKNEGGSE